MCTPLSPPCRPLVTPLPAPCRPLAGPLAPSRRAPCTLARRLSRRATKVEVLAAIGRADRRLSARSASMRADRKQGDAGPGSVRHAVTVGGGDMSDACYRRRRLRLGALLYQLHYYAALAHRDAEGQIALYRRDAERSVAVSRSVCVSSPAPTTKSSISRRRLHAARRPSAASPCSAHRGGNTSPDDPCLIQPVRATGVSPPVRPRPPRPAGRTRRRDALRRAARRADGQRAGH